MQKGVVGLYDLEIEAQYERITPDYSTTFAGKSQGLKEGIGETAAVLLKNAGRNSVSPCINDALLHADQKAGVLGLQHVITAISSS